MQLWQKKPQLEYLSVEPLEDITVLLTSTLIAVVSMEAECAVGPKVLTIEYLPLERVSYTHYPIRFEKDQVKTQALIESISEINVITLLYAIKLVLKIWATNIVAQKIGWR